MEEEFSKEIPEDLAVYAKEHNIRWNLRSIIVQRVLRLHMEGRVPPPTPLEPGEEHPWWYYFQTK